MAKSLSSKSIHKLPSNRVAARSGRSRKRQPAEAASEPAEQGWVTRVYTWGSNNSGQVSTRLPTRPCAFPHAVTELDAAQHTVRKAITAVACGHDTSFVISINGNVYSWGKGPIGRKGNSNKIARVLNLPPIREIAVSSEHVVACAVDGRLFSWGKGKGGRLGHGNASAVSTPRIVEGLANKAVVAVAVGDQHTMVLIHGGDIFSFGSARAGQLGHGTTLDSMIPVLVPRADPADPWHAMACGANHSIACTTGGKLYGWGWSSDGRLGFNPGEEEDEGTIVDQPRRVLLPPGVDIRSVGCGHAHTLCVSSRGKIYMFGWNAHGQCGVNHTQREHVLSPTELLLSDHVVVSAYGGFAHSMAITQQRQLLSWGFGLEGQLGDGNEESLDIPTHVSLGTHGTHILSVSLGHCHSAAVVSTASLNTLTSMHKANNLQRKQAARSIVACVEKHWSRILLQQKVAAAEIAVAPPIDPPRPPVPRGMLVDEEEDMPDDSKFFVTNLATDI